MQKQASTLVTALDEAYEQEGVFVSVSASPAQLLQWRPY
jgi:hypothetical protein